MIIRAIHNRHNPYFMVRRATAQDKQLPARALGVLLYLMSKPDTWEPTIEDICRRFPDVGREQAYKIINEVFIPLGYARRIQERKDGKISQWVTEIYEVPVTENQQLEHAELDADFQDVGLPDADYQMLKTSTIDINRIESTEEKLQKEENTDIGAAAPKPAKREPDARTQHVAIQLCREITSRYPPKELWDKVIETLGDNPDAALLSNCRAEWVERGYNRASWKWATEWYVTGIPERTAIAPQKQNTGVYVGKSAPTVETVDDFSMDDYIDYLIELNDSTHLRQAYDAINKRGGPKEPWEFRVYEYLNNAATEAA